MKEYQNSEAVLPDISLSVLKLSGSKMHLLADPSVTVHVMIHVQLLLVAEWCIFILKRISVPIPALSVVQKNGITLYKIRTTVERDINHIKDNLCLAGRRTQNEKTLHADLILAGITQLITVVLSDKINHHEFIRSLKPLIA